VHDRRIDGEPNTFGNAGGLFMRAMTWFDHETQSIWSQPWGRAIKGPHKNIELFLLPSKVTTWASWRSEHPDTLVMINEVDKLGAGRQGFRASFVIGITLQREAKAYHYSDVEEQGVINDSLGALGIVVWAQGEAYSVHFREVEGRTLTFRADGDQMVDEETGTIWDAARGLAIDGPLEGQVLQPVPSITAYDWAWLDFYPESSFYIP
jgi:hypothetical protein